MLLNLKISTSIEVNASVVKTWDALTNPEIIKEYLFGTETITDWKAGSPIIFQGEWNGQNYKDKGVILEIIPEKLLKYSYWSGFSGIEDKPENYAIVTYQLSSNGNQTTLKITQEGFAGEKSYESSQKDWGLVLDKMKEIIEKK